jgi:IclR family KDG regulon transcriptional repressor
MPESRPDGKYLVPSVDVAMRVLSHLGRRRHQRETLPQLTEQLGVPRTTLMRVVKTLVHHGALMYEPAERVYTLGPTLMLLGQRAEAALSYIQLARDRLGPIAAETGWTAFLVHRIRFDHLTYVAKEDSPRTLHVSVTLGQEFPLERGLFGRLFCAFLPEAECWRAAPNRMQDPAFRPSLEAVRRQGYAVAVEEQMPGVTGIAAPVFDHRGRPIMALAVVALAAAVTPEFAQSVGRRLREEGLRVTEAMGGHVPNRRRPASEDGTERPNAPHDEDWRETLEAPDPPA